MENYIVINGRKAELTPEQLKALGIETKKENYFARENFPQRFYLLNSNGYVQPYTDYGEDYRIPTSYYNAGNYCTSRKMMIQRGYYETLNRLLWRYSMEHNGDEIDCTGKTHRYHVCYRPWDNTYAVCRTWDAVIDVGKIYFIDEQTARNAIKEVIEPFIAKHPDFKLG